MPSNNHSIMFPEFIIHLVLNWDNFFVQNSSVLREINIVSLEPKMFCVLNGVHSYHKNNWYYTNLGSIRRKLVQVAQINCTKCLLESSVLHQRGFWWKLWFKEHELHQKLIVCFALTECFKIEIMKSDCKSQFPCQFSSF